MDIAEMIQNGILLEFYILQHPLLGVKEILVCFFLAH